MQSPQQINWSWSEALVASMKSTGATHERHRTPGLGGEHSSRTPQRQIGHSRCPFGPIQSVVELGAHRHGRRNRVRRQSVFGWKQRRGLGLRCSICLARFDSGNADYLLHPHAFYPVPLQRTEARLPPNRSAPGPDSGIRTGKHAGPHRSSKGSQPSCGLLARPVPLHGICNPHLFWNCSYLGKLSQELRPAGRPRAGLGLRHVAALRFWLRNGVGCHAAVSLNLLVEIVEAKFTQPSKDRVASTWMSEPRRVDRQPDAIDAFARPHRKGPVLVFRDEHSERVA